MTPVQGDEEAGGSQEVAAVFTFGREEIIPRMFSALLPGAPYRAGGDSGLEEGIVGLRAADCWGYHCRLTGHMVIVKDLFNRPKLGFVPVICHCLIHSIHHIIDYEDHFLSIFLPYTL